MDEESQVVTKLKAHFGASLTEATELGSELRLTVAPEQLVALCIYLQDEPTLRFDYPADLMAYEAADAFHLWYRLVAMASGRTAIVHVPLPHDDPVVESVTPIWPGMNWHERESFDLYGVQFVGHPDSDDSTRMRILLPEDWEGHPFRKDYTPVFTGDPLHGPQARN